MQSISEFAGKIKQKYPQYKSLSDQELTQKMVAKYPQYKAQVDMGGQSSGSAAQPHQPLSPIHFQGRANQSGGMIPQDPNVKSAQGILPSIGGTIGSVAGDVLAAPTGETASPLTGGALGGVGGAVGQTLQDLIGGVNPLKDVKGITAAGGEQAAYGAIPGVSEGKLGMKLAARGIGGALGGAGAQVASNVQNQRPVTQNVPESALITGAVNEIVPGGSDALGLLKSGAGKAADVLDKSMRSHQVGLGLAESPVVKPFIHADPQVTHDQLLQGMQDKWKNDIAPVLQSATGKVNEFIGSLNKAVISTPSGVNSSKTKLLSNIKKFVMNQTSGTTKRDKLESDVSLEVINKAKTQIGAEFGFDSPLYKAASDYIQGKVASKSKNFPDLMYQYGQLRQAADAVAPVLQQKGLHTLSGGQWASQLELGAAGAGFAMGGVPGALGAVSAAKAGSHLINNPDMAQGLSKILTGAAKKHPRSGGIVNSALQQIGVRTPGIITQ